MLTAHIREALVTIGESTVEALRENALDPTLLVQHPIFPALLHQLVCDLVTEDGFVALCVKLNSMTNGSLSNTREAA